MGVLMGGQSSEREVSLKSGAACAAALARLGYRLQRIDVDPQAVEALWHTPIDVAFIALHGRGGEDGAIQGLLETLRIPYTGSGVLASAIGMNKWISRAVLLQAGIPVVPQAVLRTPKDTAPLPIDYPIVVKPISEGSSLGVSIVHSAEGLPQALSMAADYGPEVIVETYIAGREVQVGLLGERALGVTEIRTTSAFYDYTAKYTPGVSEHLCPAPLSKPIYHKVMEVAECAYRAVGCRGAARVDLRLAHDTAPYVLEINTLPGMTETSLLPDIARAQGIDFDTLVEHMLNRASLDR